MPDYREMYFKLMAKVADAIDILTEVQQECEDIYINDDEDEE